MDKRISIQFKSAAYRMLKKMPGKLWFIFGEFIDNSISSYLQNRELLEEINGSDYRLRIELSFDEDDKITITDNAAGIDDKNWERALMPGDIPEDDKGLNEFGMGMKYSAVWLSNYWVLKSKSIKDDFQRIVPFDYHKVVTEGLEELTYEENFDSNIKHGTQLILTQLESSRLRPFQKKKIQNHIRSIYRNFIREEHSFYSKYKVDSNIDIIAFGEKLNYIEPGFLKTQWHKDRHDLVPVESSPEVEWKYEFNEIISNPAGNSKIRFSGFIGILPEIKQGNNGFSFFRRGRVVEGSGDEKIFPKTLSTNPGSFRYKRLYGEFHFDDTKEGKVESTFNKNAFQDEKFITFCIDTLPIILKSISFPEIPHKKLNFLTQADKHRSNFDPEAAKKVIDKFAKKEKKIQKDLDWVSRKTDRIEKFTRAAIQKEEDKVVISSGKSIPNEVFYTFKNPTTKIEYNFTLNYWESINVAEPLFSLSKGDIIRKNGTLEESQDISIKVNLKHNLFINNESFRNDDKLFGIIINTIKCLCYSELVAKEAGTTAAHYLRNTFNEFVDIFIHE